MPKTIFISAGEASGEAYGAELLLALQGLSVRLQAFGMGGPKMRAAGCDLTVDAAEVSVVGLFEVVRHLPRIRGRFHRLLAEIDRRKPSAAVLIDFPDFNLRLARELHRRGIPVIYYVSPQLWAWRTGRIRQIKKQVTKMLVIFPFEEKFYRRHGVDVEYVGHPLADIPKPEIERTAFAAEHNIDPARTWIALLPGSRIQEIEQHLGPMLEAALRLGDGLEFILPAAKTIPGDWLAAQIASDTAGKDLRLKIVHDAQAALSLARAAIVASGTATVEAALIGTPFVTVYRVSPLTWAFGRPLVKVSDFAMPNLIAGRRIVPELIQGAFTAENVVRELQKIIPGGPARDEMLTGLAGVRSALHPAGTKTASQRTAEAVAGVLARTSESPV